MSPCRVLLVPAALEGIAHPFDGVLGITKDQGGVVLVEEQVIHA